MSCRRLAQLAWGQTASETDAESVIRPLVFRLRSKLEPNPHYPLLIRTARRRGYYLTRAGP